MQYFSVINFRGLLLMKLNKRKNALLLAMLTMTCVWTTSHARVYLTCYTAGASKDSAGQPICQGKTQISGDPALEIPKNENNIFVIKCADADNLSAVPYKISASCNMGGLYTDDSMTSCEGSPGHYYTDMKVKNTYNSSGIFTINSIVCAKSGEAPPDATIVSLSGCNQGGGFTNSCV
jgi:hypothetical protein